MSRDRAFRVVADFEAALCEFTGAPFAVTVDAATNAIYLSLLWEKSAARTAPRGYGFVYAARPTVALPRRTYVGVAQAAKNAGYEIVWTGERWQGYYALGETIIDSAKHFERGMYEAGTLTCVSFQAGKLLPIGRGGAILHDDAAADEWFRRARLDGRTAGADYQDATYQTPGYHCYMTPPDAARGLWLLTYLEDDDKGDYTEYPDLSEATWV